HRHQPAAARRPDGLRALARPPFDRTAAEGGRAAAEGALDLDAEHRSLVSRPGQWPNGVVFSEQFPAFFIYRGCLPVPANDTIGGPASRQTASMDVRPLRTFGTNCMSLC